VFSWTLHPHHDTFCENVHRLRKLRSYRLDSMGSPPKPQIVQLKIGTNIYPTREQPDPYGSSAGNNGTFRENTLKKLKGYRTITMELLSIMPKYSARTPTDTMPKNLISDASRQSSVTRKKRVTILASVIRANQ
jgi:hypothetical protein